MNSRLANIQHVALDLDGTVYLGGTLLATTMPFLALLEELGIGYTFLTNNPSKSTAEYLAHLRRIGIAAAPSQLYTSPRRPSSTCAGIGRRCAGLFVLGTTGLCRDLEAAGFTLLPDDPGPAPMPCWWASTRL